MGFLSLAVMSCPSLEITKQVLDNHLGEIL